MYPYIQGFQVLPLAGMAFTGGGGFSFFFLFFFLMRQFGGDMKRHLSERFRD
jgi:hypothetical protein